MESDSKRSPSIWRLFTREDNCMAACKKCDKTLSYRAGTSNLRKHWTNKHAQDGDISDASDGGSIDSDKKVKEDESKCTWQYFDIPDSDSFVAKCKFCDQEVSYETMAELKEHAKEHGAQVSDDENVSILKSNNSPDKRGGKKKSIVWRYMQVVDEVEKLAVCVVCKQQLSFATTVSNLLKHFKRKHPHVLNIGLTSDNDDKGVGTTKKLLVAADGQMYEIEGTTDEEKDPIQTDEVFLEDSINDSTRMIDDNVVRFPSLSVPPKKKYKYENKTHKRGKTAKRRTLSKNDTSDEETLATHKRKNKIKSDSLHYFGEYMVALLKELPNEVSNKLQGEFIRQIMATKSALTSSSYSSVGGEKASAMMNESTNVLRMVNSNEIDAMGNGVQKREENETC